MTFKRRVLFKPWSVPYFPLNHRLILAYATANGHKLVRPPTMILLRKHSVIKDHQEYDGFGLVGLNLHVEFLSPDCGATSSLAAILRVDFRF